MKTISTFCTRFPSIFSGAWTMIFLINSLTIAGVSSFIPTYLRIIAVVKKIGQTTYIVRVHFSKTSKETMSDKIKRMLKNEIQQM